MTSGRVDQASVPGALRNHARRIAILEALLPGGGMPHVHLRQDLNGVTFNNASDHQISLGTFLAVPINNGGVIDPDVFSLSGGGPWDHITILQPGIYYAEARCGWWRDWGKASINLLFSHSSGATFPVSDSYGFTDSVPSEPGVTFNPIGTEAHEQTACCRRGMIMVDKYAGTVDVWTDFRNDGGVNRTFNNTTNVGAAQLFVMRLSANPNSNPAYP
jgi:hypothetical protein